MKSETTVSNSGGMRRMRKGKHRLSVLCVYLDRDLSPPSRPIPVLTTPLQYADNTTQYGWPCHTQQPSRRCCLAG